MIIVRKLLLIVLSFCSFSLFADEPLIKPEEEPALYKTEISQVTPQSGITTGHVIAYGHYIKPPYKVEIKKDTMLFINGVQIFPVLPSKFEIEKKRRQEMKIENKYSEARVTSKPYRERLRSLFKQISINGVRSCFLNLINSPDWLIGKKRLASGVVSHESKQTKRKIYVIKDS